MVPLPGDKIIASTSRLLGEFSDRKVEKIVRGERLVAADFVSVPDRWYSAARKAKYSGSLP